MDNDLAHKIAHQMALDIMKRVKHYADHINKKNEFRIEYVLSIAVSKDDECLEAHDLIDADYDTAEILLKTLNDINVSSIINEGTTMCDFFKRYEK
jgi:hypothetical protein